MWLLKTEVCFAQLPAGSDLEDFEQMRGPLRELHQRPKVQMAAHPSGRIGSPCLIGTRRSLGWRCKPRPPRLDKVTF